MWSGSPLPLISLHLRVRLSLPCKSPSLVSRTPGRNWMSPPAPKSTADAFRRTVRQGQPLWFPMSGSQEGFPRSSQGPGTSQDQSPVPGPRDTRSPQVAPKVRRWAEVGKGQLPKEAGVSLHGCAYVPIGWGWGGVKKKRNTAEKESGSAPQDVFIIM